MTLGTWRPVIVGMAGAPAWWLRRWQVAGGSGPGPATAGMRALGLVSRRRAEMRVSGLVSWRCAGMRVWGLIGWRRAGMRMAAALGLALLAGACRAGGGAPVAGGWGIAQKVPGLAALNTGTGGGGGAGITAVSCGSPGNCSAIGSYTVGEYRSRPFVVSQVLGTWAKARPVPGLEALDKGGHAKITSVSCASAGNCAAGGGYAGDGQAFVITEARGVWGRAREVRGLAELARGRPSGIDSLSCASAGDCSAVGTYGPGSGRVFAVSQVHGTWGSARKIPGIAALAQGRGATAISSVSCGSAGDCAAGGYYEDGSGNAQAFVVSQARGTWGRALEVPGTAALNTGGAAVISSVSCASAGNCSAGGEYNAQLGEAFVVSEVHGTWGMAREVPGMPGLNTGDNAEVLSVSCASAGNCAAGGNYDCQGSEDNCEAFVVSQARGTWGRAREVPGTAGLNTGDNAEVLSVSCASAGNCAAGGYYSDGPDPSGHPDSQAFVVTETNGTWGKALEVPGTAGLNKRQDAEISSVSCAAAGRCSAGGSYYDGLAHFQAFVVSQP